MILLDLYSIPKDWVAWRTKSDHRSIERSKTKIIFKVASIGLPWAGSSDILEMRNFGRPLAALSRIQRYKEQKFQFFQ